MLLKSTFGKHDLDHHLLVKCPPSLISEEKKLTRLYNVQFTLAITLLDLYEALYAIVHLYVANTSFL